MVSQPRIIKPEILDELLKDYQNPDEQAIYTGVVTLASAAWSDWP
jgi:hypothetical protein